MHSSKLGALSVREKIRIFSLYRAMLQNKKKEKKDNSVSYELQYLFIIRLILQVKPYSDSLRVERSHFYSSATPDISFFRSIASRDR